MIPTTGIPLDNASLDASVAADGIAKLAVGNRRNGCAIPGHPPALFFHLPDALAHLHRQGTAVATAYYLNPYCGAFGSSRNIYASLNNMDALTICTVSSAEEAFQSLASGHFLALFINNQQVIYAEEVRPSEWEEALREAWAQADTCNFTSFDAEVYLWLELSFLQAEGLGGRSGVLRLTNKDRLSLGWIRSYRDMLVSLTGDLEGLKRDKAATHPKLSEAPPLVQLFFANVLQTDYQVHKLAGYLNDACCDLASANQLLRDNETAYLQADLVPHARFLHKAVTFHLCSSRFTQCGQSLIWFDPVECGLTRLELEPELFPESFPPEEYWKRHTFDIPAGLGLVVNGSSVPVNARDLMNQADLFPQADDVSDVCAAISGLCAEATSHKRYTIPPAAIVDMPVGIFTRIELTECEGCVLVAFRTRKGEHWCAYLDPGHELGHVSFPIAPEDKPANGKRRSIEAGILLLLAAIVRDFWVVEERESVFDARQEGEARSKGQPTSDKPCVVYLPRVRYQQRADVPRCQKELELKDRRVHSVKAHYRKAQQPSELQMILARRYGFEERKGYTFVRPHERGKEQREVVYRSRSALRSLYTVFDQPEQKGIRVEWFQFERDVYALMDALGFTVQHIAAPRRGDNGVDLFATKGTDLEEVRWVIQCKCWKANRKVGPGVVQRLVGTLTEYPSGTRGMIATTSSFTPQAIKKADQNNIRLMDGQEFTSRIRAANT